MKKARELSCPKILKSCPGINVAKKVPSPEINILAVDNFVRLLKSVVISEGSVSHGIKTIAAIISNAK